MKIIDIFLSLRDRQYFFTLDSLQGILKYTSTSPLIGILSTKRILITVQLSIEEFCLIEVLLSIW